ncbi:hypothetical protein DBR06_SOUSAS10210030, partial [Sousa chinensis]
TSAQNPLAITVFASIMKGLLLAQPLHTLAWSYPILTVTAEEMDKKEVIQENIDGGDIASLSEVWVHFEQS